MAHVATITIDHTKVPGDLTDYVGLIVPDGSAGYSALYALCLEGGGDIRLFKSDDTTELAREIVSFSVSAETGEIHYKYSGTLSSSVDTDIHVYADGSSAEPAAGSTYGSEAVWSDYYAVYHSQTGSGSSLIDSTSNSRDGTLVEGAGWSTSGKIGNSLDLPKSNNDNAVDLGSTFGNSIGTSDATVTQWLNIDAQTTDMRSFYVGSGSSFSNVFAQIALRAGVSSHDILVQFRVGTSGAGAITYNPAGGLTNGSWYKVAVKRDSTTATLYVDGVSVGTVTSAEVGTDPDGQGWIGNEVSGSGNNAFEGQIDETRLRLSAVSDNWEEAEYNNQNSYSTFYSVAAVAGGSTPAQVARRGAVMMM